MLYPSSLQDEAAAASSAVGGDQSGEGAEVDQPGAETEEPGAQMVIADAEVIFTFTMTVNT